VDRTTPAISNRGAPWKGTRVERRETALMPPSRYELTVRGEPNRTLEAAFEEFELRPGNGVTILVGELPDQAALHGVIARIGIFGLELLDVHLACDGPLRA
jgi:hypothetical protein